MYNNKLKPLILILLLICYYIYINYFSKKENFYTNDVLTLNNPTKNFIQESDKSNYGNYNDILSGKLLYPSVEYKTPDNPLYNDIIYIDPHTKFRY